MRASPPPAVRRATRHRWIFTGHAGANLLLAGWLFFLLNYLTFDTYRRWDISLDQGQGLAPKTVEVLRSLNAPVQIHILFKPDHPNYQLVESLLAAYRAESHWIRLEHVDPDRDVARTEQLSRAFALQQPNVLLFESDGRREIIPADDLVEYDVAQWQAGQRPERSIFRGEQLFTSALLAITQPRRPVVYFLQGHGEHAVDESERRSGYSEIVRIVQRDYFEIRPLTLTGPGALPADCDVLVVAGPRTPLAPTAVEQIARFLERNGRLLALLNHGVDTGLESLLANWGVRVGTEQIIDPTRSPSGREIFVTEYPPHPITRPLAGLHTVFYLPRLIEPFSAPPTAGESPADQPVVLPLAVSTAAGWGESNLPTPNQQFSPDLDRSGPVAFAVAVERGPRSGSEVQIRPTRLVVVGDSAFVANGLISGGNAEFFLAALNWLAQRDDLLVIPPRSVSSYHLLLSLRAQRRLALLVIFVIPGLIACLGLAVVWRRRR